MKCCIMWHFILVFTFFVKFQLRGFPCSMGLEGKLADLAAFIRVFTVCKSTRLVGFPYTKGKEGINTGTY